MPQVYKSGDIVPESGIYRFVHDPGHAPPAEMSAIKGDLFPTCRYCRNAHFERASDAFDVGEIEQWQA
jgi:hypothetical protein